MPRFRLRLATLGLLIVIIALATALVVQWRRETDLRLQVHSLRLQVDRLLNANAALQATNDRQQRLLQTRSGSSGSSSLPPGESQDIPRERPVVGLPVNRCTASSTRAHAPSMSIMFLPPPAASEHCSTPSCRWTADCRRAHRPYRLHEA